MIHQYELDRVRFKFKEFKLGSSMRSGSAANIWITLILVIYRVSRMLFHARCYLSCLMSSSRWINREWNISNYSWRTIVGNVTSGIRQTTTLCRLQVNSIEAFASRNCWCLSNADANCICDGQTWAMNHLALPKVVFKGSFSSFSLKTANVGCSAGWSNSATTLAESR